MAFFTSSMFCVSLLLQNGLRLSPLEAGLCFGPFCLAAVISALAGGRLVTRWGGPSVIRAGCGLSALGTALLAIILQLQAAAAGAAWLVVTLVIGLGIVGAGNSMVLTAYLGATLAGVRPAQAGAASGTVNTIQQFAGVAGLAGIGAVFYAVLGRRTDIAGYAHATAAVLWTALALIAVMAMLTRFLPGPLLTGVSVPAAPAADTANQLRQET
jgi:MFS family permease